MSIHVPDIETFTRAHPDTQFVDVLLPDLLSTPRGKRLKFDALPAVYAGAFRLPGSIFAMDALGNMNGTVVAIDPSNGRILAMVNQIGRAHV